MFDAPSMIGIALVFAVTFVITFVATPTLGKIMKRRGIIGKDVHKLSKPEVPEMCGLAILLALIVGVAITVFYPLLIPVAVAVTSNGVNMMDVMNGAMPGTVSVICAATTAVLLLSGKTQVAAISVGLLAAMLAFYYFTRFPAKVFSGDTGSLAVGAALGAIAILGRLETVMIVALIPHIMNAFYGLASVGRLYERREISQRPTRLLEDGRLEASSDRNAPITLTRLILSAGPLGEKEIVRGMIFLTVVSSLLAIITYWITVVGRICKEFCLW